MVKNDVVSGEKLWTYRQLADLLQCSEKTVYNFVQRGDLVPFRCGGLVRFTGQCVEEFLERNSKVPDKPMEIRNPEVN